MSDPEGLSRHPTGYFASFLAATAFFTRVPVDQRGAVVWRLADSAWAFPLVGAGIGGAAALAGVGDVIHASLALIAAHAASRAALAVAMWGLAPARPDGLGAQAGTPRAPGAIAAAVIGAAIALAALGPDRGAIALCLAGG